MQVHSHQAKHNRVLPPLHRPTKRPKEQWEPELAGSHHGSALRVRHGEGFNLSEEGELSKIINLLIAKWHNPNVDQAFDEILLLLQRQLTKAKKEFPLNPQIEMLTLLNGTAITQQDYFKNCNMERFCTDTIQWFKRWFGSGESK